MNSKTIILKTDEEIELMRHSNRLVGMTLGELSKHIKPGVTTLQLDKIAEEFIRDHGAIPTFLGYGGFPNSICASVNEQVVHGIPNNLPLKEGDIVSIDCGTCLQGYCGDSAYTFCVGEVKAEVRRLLDVTREALYKGIEQACQDKRIGD
ncbi:type I methionyl aminopeptidase, partial [Petrimonas mucosa]